MLHRLAAGVGEHAHNLAIARHAADRGPAREARAGRHGMGLHDLVEPATQNQESEIRIGRVVGEAAGQQMATVEV